MAVKSDRFRGEFDDYKYPSLKSGVDSKAYQQSKEKKDRAMAEAIELAAELKRKHGK